MVSNAYASSDVTVASLTNLIARELPIGSSKEQIMAFIKAHRLNEDTDDPEKGYDPKTNAVYGIVRNVQPWYYTLIGFKTAITLIFYLDNEDKLRDYTVEEVHTWF